MGKPDKPEEPEKADPPTKTLKDTSSSFRDGTTRLSTSERDRSRKERAIAARAFIERLRTERREGADAEGLEFGPYTLLGRIGKGGMGEVRLAVGTFSQVGIGLCVIKRLLPGSENQPGHRQMFLDEARISSRLDHPNLVHLHDAGEIEGIPFMAFELIDGTSLKELQKMVAPERIPLSAALEIGRQAAMGLHYAHDAADEEGAPLSVVHRDITPHNILVDREGVVKIVDFGIARFRGRGHETKEGVKGKLGYLSPEQMQMAPVDRRTDIFSLGLVLTELISGRRVFPPKVLLVRRTEEVIRGSCKLVEGVPPELVDLLVSMTRIEASERIQTAGEVVDQIARIRLPSSETLASWTTKEIFPKLFPLDLSSILEAPTDRVVPIGVPVRFDTRSEELNLNNEPEPDLESGTYSVTLSTVRAITQPENPDDPTELPSTKKVPHLDQGAPRPSNLGLWVGLAFALAGLILLAMTYFLMSK